MRLVINAALAAGLSGGGCRTATPTPTDVPTLPDAPTPCGVVLANDGRLVPDPCAAWRSTQKSYGLGFALASSGSNLVAGAPCYVSTDDVFPDCLSALHVLDPARYGDLSVAEAQWQVLDSESFGVTLGALSPVSGAALSGDARFAEQNGRSLFLLKHLEPVETSVLSESSPSALHVDDEPRTVFPCGDLAADSVPDICVFGTSGVWTYPDGNTAGAVQRVVGPVDAAVVADLGSYGLHFVVGNSLREEGSGAVWVFPVAGASVDLAEALPAFVGAPASHFGQQLLAADFDGDLMDEVVVGSPLYNDRRGRATILSFLGGVDHGTIAENLESDVPNGHFGGFFASGDFNGDGIVDLAIGAPGSPTQNGAGAVRVISNPTAGGGGTVVEWSSGLDHRDGFGYRVVATDLDGDGVNELAVSAPFDSRYEIAGGAVYHLTQPLGR